uniref:Putative acetyltransferase n=1 Tax=Candidatus Kentrum sp. SD TaxID=2126332 RepID=A0A450Z7N3_9GAMM|nr:MAG: putative acetyltransferase [Candidatus Kentron sp. SD]VFK49811.1 MAG: putative acetyltransferase [Candidatus Kentron sp. SD]
MNIRNTTKPDEPAIRQAHEAAFGPLEGRTIGDLAAALLHDPAARPLISLFACSGSTPIGHALFTSVRILGPDESPTSCILAPLAVLPDRQRQGIGTQLVRGGLAMLAKSGCELVFVLGHPGYYPRFGFQPAGRLGFSAPYPIPEKNADAWMLLALSRGLLGNTSGAVRCAESLNKPEYWRE